MEVHKIDFGHIYVENGVHVLVAEGCDDETNENWATIYTVESEQPNHGYCQELLAKLKDIYADRTFGSTVALNSKMQHILQKLNIKEYRDYD